MGILPRWAENYENGAGDQEPWPPGVWPPWETRVWGQDPFEWFPQDDDGHILEGTDGYTREQAIAQFPPIRSAPPAPWGSLLALTAGNWENDGSPPLGHAIPELVAVPTPGSNSDYVLSSGAFDNFSEFQQRKILHSIRYKLMGPFVPNPDPRWQDPVYFKENFGKILGHDRMADGSPMGYPGGFLTWPDYEQDLWVAQGGKHYPGGAANLHLDEFGNLGFLGGRGADKRFGNGQGWSGFAHPDMGLPSGQLPTFCSVAAELYGWFTPDWFAASIFLNTWEGATADRFRAAYQKHGPRWAARVRLNKTAREAAHRFFDPVVALMKKRRKGL